MDSTATPLHPSAAQMLIDAAALVTPNHAAVLAVVVALALAALTVAMVARS